MDDFFKLEEGCNQIRVITQPYQYYAHPNYLPKGNKHFEQKLKCCSSYGYCKMCESGDPPHPRWILGIISRQDQNAYLFDTGFFIFKGLRNLARDPIWGDPQNYDVHIYMKHGEYNGEYSVIALPKTELTAQDQLIKENFSLDCLKLLTEPADEIGPYVTFDSVFDMCGSSD